MTRRDCLGTSLCALAHSTLARDAHAQTIDQEIRKMASAPPLQMQFRGSTAAECRAWQSSFRAKLDGMLGNYQPPQKWETVEERTVDCGDHSRQELVLRAEGVRDLPIYLLRPKTSGRRAGILALHGHGPHGHDPVAGIEDSPTQRASIAGANYDYGRQLVRQGYVVATPCFTPFGRRLGDRAAYKGEDPCGVTFIRMQLFGKLLLSENLRDALWTLELLAGHEQVDPARLGCVGLSLGGRMTMMVAAVSPKIRVAVASGTLNVLQERVRGRYSCGAQIIPGLLQYGDVPEIASLFAPRPLLWEVGRKDGLMVPEFIQPSLDRMRRAWTALGTADGVDVDFFDGGHRWNGVKAVPLLNKKLQS